MRVEFVVVDIVAYDDKLGTPAMLCLILTDRPIDTTLKIAAAKVGGSSSQPIHAVGIFPHPLLIFRQYADILYVYELTTPLLDKDIDKYNFPLAFTND